MDEGREEGLARASIQIGSAILDVSNPIPRCVMVARPQPGLQRDLQSSNDLQSALLFGRTELFPSEIA